MDRYNIDDKINVLKVILNGQEYKLPINFAKTSQLLNQYISTNEIPFLYDDTSIITIFIKYWDKYKKDFVIRLYEDIVLNKLEFMDLPNYILSEIKILEKSSRSNINIKDLFRKLNFFGYDVIIKSENELDTYLETKRKNMLIEFKKFLEHNCKKNQTIFNYYISLDDINEKITHPFTTNYIIDKINTITKKNILQVSTISRQLSNFNIYYGKYKNKSHIYSILITENNRILNIEILLELKQKESTCWCW